MSIDAILAEVAAERLRQIAREGWSHQHDDGHTGRELAGAAAAYAWAASLDDVDRREVCAHLGRQQQRGVFAVINHIWPASWDAFWFKPKTRRQDLIRSAALLLAEVERLDRQARRQAA